MQQVKFCPFCGKGLVMRYPGGDPENGPAGMRCSDDAHVTVGEMIEDAVNQQAREAFQQNLEEIQQGGPDPNMRPPDAVRQAAELLLVWEEHTDLQYDQLRASSDADWEDYHPEDMEEDPDYVGEPGELDATVPEQDW